MLTPIELEPPIGGWRIVCHDDLEMLASRGHRVQVLALTEQADRVDGPIEEFGMAEYFYCPSGNRVVQVLGNLGNPLPYSITRRRNAHLERRALELIRAGEVDVILVEDVVMAEHAECIREQAPMPMVVRGHTVLTNMSRRVYLETRNPLVRFMAWRQAEKFRQFEVDVAKKFEQISQISRVDAEEFQRITGRNDIDTLFPTMDLDYYSPGPFEDREPDTIMSCCTLEPRTTLPAMLWLYDEVWPRIQERCPNAKLELAGRTTPSKLDDVRADNFTLHGPVPDMRPYLNRGSVFISPMFAGSGIRLSLLNAMATGNAIVSNRVSAEGVPYTDGEDLFIADDPERFSDAVCSLLEDRELRRRVSERARGLMTGGLFGFARNAERLEEHLRNAMRRSAGE